MPDTTPDATDDIDHARERARRFRAKAEELRKAAEAMTPGPGQDVFRHLADSYDKLADDAGRRAERIFKALRRGR
jgi:hypothetical protein